MRCYMWAGRMCIIMCVSSVSCRYWSLTPCVVPRSLSLVGYSLRRVGNIVSSLICHGSSAPPTNQSSYHKWTIGPIFYSVLAVAEALGSSNNSQVIDLAANGNNDYTPGYAIYEGGTLARLALLNFMTDPSGANAYVANISIGGGSMGQPNAIPAQVQVKCVKGW